MASSAIQPPASAAEPSPAARITVGSLVLPGLFVVAWAFALSGATPTGAVAGESTAASDLRWMLWFVGFVFIASSVMHSVFAKKTAASIGWVTNGFQYELAAASLGMGLACLYAITKGAEALVTISIPVIAFLFLAGVNHVVEIVRERNYAPNNTLILVWDFGMSISLAVLCIAVTKG
ncbi:MAG: DUF6790 family protein [Acidimicrobiia bacterium]